ncbi:MAG: choice-of-anchor tandem repeat GloVer-containing protein, partial [Candidatus Sulfotelmatobacter sp.]
MRKALEQNIYKLVAILGVTFALANHSWAGEKILYTFAGQPDGYGPEGSLIFDSEGNLYGTTYFGGTDQAGTVFELSPGSGGTWTEKILYNFTGGQDGEYPDAGLIFDSKGNLYGTTSQGGFYNWGTVFELIPGAGGTWAETILCSFGSSGFSDALFPANSLIQDQAGNLYGNAQGGANYSGAVFELSPGSNGTWTEKVLHSFNGNDGAFPSGALVMDQVGRLYGTTYAAGPDDYGSIFELTPGSGGNWTEKVIFSFNGVNGISPFGGVLFDSAGNAFGTSELTAFELTHGSNGVWTGKTLHSFTGGFDGAFAYSGLIFDKQGNLYGTTYSGGQHYGTVFKLT